MGLIKSQNENKPENNVNQTNKVPEKSLERNKIIPIVIVFLILALLAGLIAGGYWLFIHQDELIGRFSPPQSIEKAPGGKVPEEKTSFFKKLVKKDRTITVRGTLLGEEGGAAALINKKVVPVGTLINGVRILEITNQSIVIQSDGLKRRLQVGESFNPDAR